MNGPLVSICLPNLNTFPYLRERIDTILEQTYNNWELIVVDSFSDDGAWELFQELAGKDRRVFITQAPRGEFECWNNCIERARGEYVYIATSDDTMASDCLETLVAALEEREDCDLAHCTLKIIDRDGASMENLPWRDAAVFAKGSPELATRRHLRRAPYDGLLHLTGQMVYQSITELLIRRSLFAKIGGFRPTWGSIGDLYWDMKAGLVANTIHVPETWASWRMHPAQKTMFVGDSSADHVQKVGEMIREAVLRCESYLAPEVVGGLKNYWLRWSNDMRAYYAGMRNRPSFIQRRLFQASQMGEKTVCGELLHRLRGKPRWPERAPGEIRAWLESLGLRPVVACES